MWGGPKEHVWLRPGHLRTPGPGTFIALCGVSFGCYVANFVKLRHVGTYKLPSMDDIPREFNGNGFFLLRCSMWWLFH